MPILAIGTSTISLQSTRKRVFRNGTNTNTTSGHRNLKNESAQRDGAMKKLSENEIFVRFHTSTF